jgi:hypothetical protein
MKKHIFIVIAALAIAAGCSNIAQEPVYKPNSGLVSIRLHIPGEAGQPGETARTIMPGGVSASALFYTLAFTQGETVHNETIDSGVTTTVSLEEGHWDLVVCGYQTGDDRQTGPAKAVVRGTASFYVVSQDSGTVLVSLAAASGTETGTFSYTVIFPDTVGSAFLTISDPAGAKPQIRNLLASSGSNTITTGGSQKTAAGTMDLSGGYYRAGLELYDATNSAIAGKSEILHIAGGLTSSAEYTFAAANFAYGPVSVPYATSLPVTLAGILAGSSGDYVVELPADESCVFMDLKAATGKEFVITLMGGGHMIDPKSIGKLFGVGAPSASSGKVALVLKNITLRGRADNNAPLVTIEQTGSLVLENGAVVKDNVNVYGNGGGVYVSGGSFAMNGGTIEKNTSSSTSYIGTGGGVYVNGGIFTMNGGTIKENVCGKPASLGHGGGVSIGAGSFIMNNGEISGNTAQSYGGGVCVNSGNLTVNGGEISGNRAPYGGGAALSYLSGSPATIVLSGSGKITRNTASSNGGGVYVSNGTLTVSGGEILENTASTPSTAFCGGVYSFGGNLVICGGEIADNDGYGVYLYSMLNHQATIAMSGDARITPTGNGGHSVCLNEDSITIGGAFTGSGIVARVDLIGTLDSWLGKNVLSTDPAGGSIAQAVIDRFQLGSVHYSTPLTGYKIDEYGKLAPQ